MKKTFTSAFMCILLMLGTHTFAQQNRKTQQPKAAPTEDCLSDDIMQHQLTIDPALRDALLETDAQFAQYIKEQGWDSQSGEATYYIPVVFHLIHSNNNITFTETDATNAINTINGFFATYETTIRFCKARRTPGGSATTGVVSINSTKTNHTWDATEELALKNLSRWDINNYLNVWVVTSITTPGGTAYNGYSSFPWGTNNSLDGVVIKKSRVNTNTFAHESGHFSGLYHTFQSENCTGNTSSTCATAGDRVCDTPTDKKWSDCPTPARNDCYDYNFPSDLSNYQNNIMTYTSCRDRFTAGQKTRMRYYYDNTTKRINLRNSMGCIPPGISRESAQLSASFVYPNPSQGDLNIRFESAQNLNSTLKVYDLSGRLLIAEERASTEGINEMHMDVRFLQPGVYMFELLNQSQAIQHRFVIK